MHRAVYNTQHWRDLPRDGDCVVSFLFGKHAGPCRGLTAHHHVDPDDPLSRTVLVCARHHRHLETALKHLDRTPTWKRCRHDHRYDHGRRECEAKLNGVASAA